MSAPVFAAADDPNDDDAGQLSLNTDVLVNEAVGAGSAGDFAVRSSLFSEDLSANVQAQRERAAERLKIVESLDFAGVETSAVDYRSVRAALFDEYSSLDVLQATDGDNQVSPAFYGVAAVLVVPLVLLIGVLLGRSRAKRKRAEL